MKILDRIFKKSTASSATTLSNATAEEISLLKFLGIEPSPDRGALSEATYFACLKVLSESIGKMPLRLLKKNENSGVIPASEHALWNVVHSRPNPYMTASTFWSTVEYNRNHYGNAYVWIQGAGRNTKLWILPNECVRIYIDDAKILADQPDIYYVYNECGVNYKFGSEEVMHFKTSNTFDGVVGVSVREQLAGLIRAGNLSQDMLIKMYENGFTAKAVLNYTGSLSDANVAELLKMTEGYAKGSLNNGSSAIIPMPIGYSLTPLNVKLSDNQFLEVRQYTALQIASCFGIKPYQVGNYDSSSYSSAEAQQLAFFVETLLYIMKQYEEEMSYKLLSKTETKKGYQFKFDTSSILRADLATQVETLSKGVSNFIYTPNEARAMLDLASMEGGDKLLGNGASIPVELTGYQYIDAGADGGEEDE